MKFKGNTLIELILVMSIILLTIGYFSKGCMKKYEKIKEKRIIKYCDSYIMHIIDDSILHCKVNNNGGYLLFTKDNKIKFYCNNNKIYSYSFPLGIKFQRESIIKFNNKIGIDNLGKVVDPCTIKYKYKKGESHYITIRVATRYVEVK